jgi:hypothetical protein
MISSASWGIAFHYPTMVKQEQQKGPIKAGRIF